MLMHHVCSGGRICPGQHMGLANASYIITRFLQEFKWIESRDEMIPWKEDLRLVTANANGVTIALTPA